MLIVTKEEIVANILDNPPAPLLDAVRSIGNLVSGLTLAVDTIVPGANAVTAGSYVAIGGKVALHLVHGHSNLLATGFFTLSIICCVAGAASTGVQLA